jgi:hypothetical protein
MIPDLPVARELDCELKIRAIRRHGLKEPQRLLDTTLTLIRQVYTLEHSLLTALRRISELQVSLALAQDPKKRNQPSQHHYELAAQLSAELDLDMP